MSENILKALMQLFALVANVGKEGNVGLSRKVVKNYLTQQLNTTLQNQYLQLFDEYLEFFHKGASDGLENKKRVSSNSVRILQVCKQINNSLRQEQKVVVLIQLLEFVKNGLAITPKELEFIETVGDAFNIPEDEYADISTFVLLSSSDIPNPDKLLVVAPTYKGLGGEHFLQREQISGRLYFLHIASTNTFAFKYEGTQNLYQNGINIRLYKTYVLNKGASIRCLQWSPIYYTDVVSAFLHDKNTERILFEAKNVEFKFRNSTNGLQKLNLSQSSGEMLGVMGGSGVGKSTLLNVLNGNIKPQKGTISINGFDIFDEEEKQLLEGVIGFVPQDDLLIEELTVFQNLYYNAKLCFRGYSEEQLVSVVEKTLADLELFEFKDLTVGNPTNKFISGGQRKRLNIALELIREPAILFVDEPTSGLSSMDSDMVMDLLKQQALKGKLVIINIHQPSSEIYKLFDKILVMDRGGYLIYNGNPLDAILYFKKKSNYVNAEECECENCGNVNPEQVLQIVEARMVDEYGRLTKTRQVSPEEWYKRFNDEVSDPLLTATKPDIIPENNFSVPSQWEQFKIFLQRNIHSKLTDKQYLLVNFLEAPLLAFILGYFSKYISGTPENQNEYVFSLNENLPSYLFMCVVVALFLGMTISAEEIIKDRRILQRERFLNLSRWSYLNSKVILMFGISAIQVLSFLIVGNSIVEIKGLFFNYFAILYSVSCFANMLGLIISSGLTSVVTIYILIPFLLVPQLLLSGVIVKFDKLHSSIASKQYVSVVGDLMASRWAYEALAVNQFAKNEYQKIFFQSDLEISNASYLKNFYLPELLKRLQSARHNYLQADTRKRAKEELILIGNEIALLENKTKRPFSQKLSWDIESFTPQHYSAAKNYFELLRLYYDKIYEAAYEKRDNMYIRYNQKYGANKLIKLKQNYHNEALADLVLNTNQLTKISQSESRLIQEMDPIYRIPESRIGRAHFYSAYKRILGRVFDTVWFNITILWLATATLYIILIGDLFRKLISFLESIRFSDN